MVNTLDLIVGAVLAFFLIRGLFRGLFLELASIAGVVLAFYLANKYQTQAGAFLERWVDSPSLTHLLGYVIVFVGVLLGVSLLAHFLQALLRIQTPSFLAAAGGAVIGAAKGFAIVIVALANIALFKPDAAFLQQSLTYAYLGPVITAVQEQLPRYASKMDPAKMLENMDEEQMRLLERFIASDPERKEALDAFMNASPEERRRMIEEYTAKNGGENE